MSTSCLTQEHSGFDTRILIKAYLSVGVRMDHAKTLVHQVTTWYRSNGILWTVSHLQKVKQLYVNRMAREGIPPDWISRKRGLPDNAFALLVSYPLHVIVKAINVYKVFSLPPNELTEAQASKHLNAINRPAPDQDAVEAAKSLVRIGSARFVKDLRVIGEVPTLAALKALSPEETDAFDKMYLRAVNFCLDTNVLGVFPWLEKAIHPFSMREYHSTKFAMETHLDPNGVPSFLGRRLSQLNVVRSFRQAPIGELHYTQEPGLKCRLFASPNMLYQAGLEPLKRGLAATLRSIPEDCTFDQRKGLIAAREALIQGKTVHSVDLSSATDRFPYVLQADLLSNSSVPQEFISLLNHVVEGFWVPNSALSKAGFSSRQRWNVGQPLGAGPSFFLFGLTHNALVRGLFIAAQKPYAYAMVGDDILIWDDDVAKQYVLIMNRLGCEVSPSKTISSSHIAEFASVIVGKDGFYGSTKHRAITLESFMDYLVEYGACAASEFCGDSPRRRKVIKALADIPEFIGGLGWNPDHLSLDDRLRKPEFESWLRYYFADHEPVVEKSRQRIIRERAERLQLMFAMDLSELSLYGSSRYGENVMDEAERESLAVAQLLSQPRWTSSHFDEKGHYIKRRPSRRVLDELRTEKEVTPNRSLFSRMARALGFVLGA